MATKIVSEVPFYITKNLNLSNAIFIVE